MGLRFRKSINLGGGFRINISKSGIGYSWGVKGFRVTQKSNGGSRTTVSIPGTGISYSQDFSNSMGNRNASGTGKTLNQQPKYHTYDEQLLENSDAEMMVSADLEEMLDEASRIMKKQFNVSVLAFVMLVIAIFSPMWVFAALLFGLYSLYLVTSERVHLIYTIDADARAAVDARMKLFQSMVESDKVWRITKTSRVDDTKYTGGAGIEVERKECKVSFDIPFPFRTEERVVVIKYGSERLILLPDKLLIMQGHKLGALSYADIHIDVKKGSMIEREKLPKDAKIIGYTWEYLNKSGEPDGRFRDNKQIPICEYGELTLSSAHGLNTQIQFSNTGLL